MHRKSAQMRRTRDFDFEIKAVEKNGTFTGYGSVFGVKDSYGEIVAPGAFKASLKARAERGRKLPVLWQHRSGEPIGVYDAVKEDATGLWVEGRLLVNEVARAKEAHALMGAGAVTGLSIGYFVIADSWNEKEKVRTLTELDLQEVSPVTFPANDEARIETVKSKLQAGQQPTLREFEELLREKGFSRADAEHIAVFGFKNWLARECAAVPSEVLQLLKDFSLQPSK
jgi:HK97 family phage prohead protease